MRIILFTITLLLLSPTFACAQSTNAGIVDGLWYSQEKIFVGQYVRVYVAIRNNTEDDLSAVVEFFEGDKRIERKNIEALGGRIVESWTDWNPRYGTTTLRAVLSRTELSVVGSSTQIVSVSSALAEDTLFIDYDTDTDGIGNTQDSDDDNDTFSDTVEVTRGTDPLTPEKKTESTAENDIEEKEETFPTNDSESGDESAVPSGLEQYLAPSRAKTLLSGTSQHLNTAKQKIDNYRKTRELSEEASTAAYKEDTTQEQERTAEDGFGEITRSTTDEEHGGGFLEKSIKVVGSLTYTLYSLVLLVLSFTLGHPMFVQLALLVLILIFLVHLASKFGRRQKNY